MAVTTVTYERLYNLGNYENERLIAVVTVEDTTEAAFAEAVQAVNDQHTLMQTEREEAVQYQRAEYEAKQQQRLAEQRQAKEIPF